MKGSDRNSCRELRSESPIVAIAIAADAVPATPYVATQGKRSRVWNPRNFSSGRKDERRF
ncbi:hypothetical protein [Phormidium sp. CCY1219]|uniref:hypothetical protein n=1 Tax=Phormidium sp. CCY1219 TaxID=2886104 RepID=UPI002D1F7E17|nr:hypothetical protein [Phormidium sp. CCY1219]MEB3827160.1 hypothetical protein [Phormidium sp. CCY1219]